MGVAEDFAYYL
jgi:hippurate hydrolase